MAEKETKDISGWNILKSKTVISGVVIAVVGIAQVIGLDPAYVEAILTVAAGFGLVGLRQAIQK